MKVVYRANGEAAVLTEDAGRQLVAAGICDAVAEPDETQHEPIVAGRTSRRKPR